MTEVEAEKFQKAIKDLHGAHGVHLVSVPVRLLRAKRFGRGLLRSLSFRITKAGRTGPILGAMKAITANRTT